MHRFSSRSDESADLTRHTTGGHRKRNLCSTLRRPGVPACGSGAPALAGRAGRADDFGAAVENLCIVRAKLARFLQLALDHPGNIVFGSGADDLILDFATVKEEQGGNPLDVVLGGRFRVLIHV